MSRIEETFIPPLASGLLLTDVHDNTPSGPRCVFRGVCVCLYEKVVIVWVSQKQTLKHSRENQQLICKVTQDALKE